MTFASPFKSYRIPSHSEGGQPGVLQLGTCCCFTRFKDFLQLKLQEKCDIIIRVWSPEFVRICPDEFEGYSVNKLWTLGPNLDLSFHSQLFRRRSPIAEIIALPFFQKNSAVEVSCRHLCVFVTFSCLAQQ